MTMLDITNNNNNNNNNNDNNIKWFPTSLLARWTSTVVVVVAALVLVQKIIRRSCPRGGDIRHAAIPPAEERVLILGASSGVGSSLAKCYAARGARLCLVARREEQLSILANLCGATCLCLYEVADFTSVHDMVRLRDRLLAAWGGLDTIHVCAGVSALKPVMALAGAASVRDDASSVGIQTALDTAERALRGNFNGPFVAAATFVPALTRTSPSPSILLVSSCAALIPAPTRALYAASKASSLLLYQALSIENPQIAFSFILPATIEGNFRASAVDGGAVCEDDPNQHGLKIDYVATRCIEALDRRTRGNVVLPWWPYAVAHHLYLLCPSFIERMASKKYNFNPTSSLTN
ncbi:NAD(P)-binding protein [Xylariomycetidae sp. FL2044]|nr:NAD(P)-binding protein [Xylariomycetidae sp. FL2044]